MRLPLLTRGLGLAYIAFAPKEERDLVLDILRQSHEPEDEVAHRPEYLSRLFAKIRKDGFADTRLPCRATQLQHHCGPDIRRTQTCRRQPRHHLLQFSLQVPRGSLRPLRAASPAHLDREIRTTSDVSMPRLGIWSSFVRDRAHLRHASLQLIPPSAISVRPVSQPASGDARNKAMPAMSSGLTNAAERRHRQNARAALGQDFGRHFRLDDAGRDRIDGDATRSEFLRKRVRQRGDRRLGRGIDRRSRNRPGSKRRRRN